MYIIAEDMESKKRQASIATVTQYRGSANNHI